MFFLDPAPMFWTVYLCTMAAVASFSVGAVCLTRPAVVLAAYRRLWDRGSKFWRLPVLGDETDARIVGVIATLLAVTIAAATVLY